MHFMKRQAINLSLRPATLIAVMVSIVTGIAMGVALHFRALHHAHGPATDLHTFEQLLAQIRDNYVEPKSEEELLDAAISGVMNRLDAHSILLDEQALSTLDELTSGQFGGIGVELAAEDGEIRIITPIDDTPAYRAGIAAGDVLERIDDRAVDGTTVDAVSVALRGAPGTPVTLAVRRGGVEEPLIFNIVRATIDIASVRAQTLEPGIGYVRISQFQVNTGAELASAIGALQAQGPLQGLVLDLRNNPGGILQASVDVADLFLTDADGLIVSTQGRHRSSDLRYVATGQDLLAGAPLVVLINKGSASAAEIVAGALQDHQRALIAGSTSYGKGSVQAVLPLEDSHALKLTTALYFTPSGRSIQGVGIQPDLELDADSAADVDSAALLTAAVQALKQRRAG
jgi:carboxyl-terminal processing protease